MNHNIGAFITAKRKELGITQQKLAEQLNVSFQAVSKWENGATVPDTMLLSQLAFVLKTSVDTILGYKAVPITEYEKKYDSHAGPAVGSADAAELGSRVRQDRGSR